MYTVRCNLCREAFPCNGKHRITHCNNCWMLMFSYLSRTEINPHQSHDCIIQRSGFCVVTSQEFEKLHEYLKTTTHQREWFRLFINGDKLNMDFMNKNILFSFSQINRIFDIISSRDPETHLQYINSFGLVIHQSIAMIYAHTLFIQQEFGNIISKRPPSQVQVTVTDADIAKIQSIVFTTKIIHSQVPCIHSY